MTLLGPDGREISPIEVFAQRLVCTACGNEDEKKFQTSEMMGGHKKVSCLKCGTLISHTREVL